MHSTPIPYGQREAAKQRLHFLSVAEFDMSNTGWQILHRRQCHCLFVDLAQLPGRQLDFKRDVSTSVQAVDLCRTALDAERGDVAQHDRPTFSRYAQTSELVQVGSHTVRQLDPNGHLPLGQIQLGQADIVIAGGRHTNRFCNGKCGHTEVCGSNGVGPDNDFRAGQARS